jgi:hypothetical protein
MVSFCCESCQDTIKKPKLESVYLFLPFIIDNSMLLDVVDLSPVLIVILRFKDEIGKVI